MIHGSRSPRMVSRVRYTLSCAPVLISSLAQVFSNELWGHCPECRCSGTPRSDMGDIRQRFDHLGPMSISDRNGSVAGTHRVYSSMRRFNRAHPSPVMRTRTDEVINSIHGSACVGLRPYTTIHQVEPQPPARFLPLREP